MKKIILLLTVCYLKLVFCDERRDLNNLFSLPDFNHSLNVATGEWIESSTDYETAGPHPLILKRLFCSSIDHSDHLTPEWKFSLPHFNHGGIPVLDHDGFKYIYNSKRELVKAENRFGQSVKIERPRPGLIELVTSHGRKIEYQFEKISNHNCLKRVKRPGNADRIYDYKEIKGSILLKKRDETDGRYLLWEHDNTGRVIKTLAPAGTTSEPKTLMSIRYFDKKTEVLNPYGYKKLYSYQDDYRINKIEHFLGDSVFKSEEMKWDNGLLLSHKIYDQNGRLIAARSLDYDEYGRLTRETWEGNITGKGNDKATRHLRYDPEGRLVYEEEEDGKTTFYKWDNHLLVYKKEGSIETFYAYNDLGLPIEERICEQDQELVTRITEYNRFGLPEKISRFSNGVWLDNKIYAYSNEGWVSSETTEKESGLTSQFYERDVSGRILSSANEKGEIEFFEYDKHGNLIRHDSLLETKVMRYDFMNRLISEEGKTAFTYDLCGNTLTKADEYGNITAFKYDAIGRIIEINAPLVNTPEGPKQPTTYFEYDCFDRIIKKIEPRGDTTYTKYNLRGQPIEIIYPDQTIETFEYSKSGRLLKKTLRNGLIQTFEYDANGRMIHFQEFNHDVLKKEKYLSYKLDKVVQEKSFETEINSFYLPDGTLERVLVNTPERQFILDCKKEIKEPADAHFQSRLIESERLNELGQWVKETTYTSESGLKVVKVYDALNRLVLTEKYDPMGGLVSKKERIYDLNGDVVQESFQGIVNRYERDQSGRVTEMIEAFGTVEQRKTIYSYDDYGFIEKVIKPDGTCLYFKHECGELKELKSSDKTVHYRFEYDKGNLIKAEDLISGKTALREYNGLNLLVKERLLNGLNLEYGYDEKGKIISLKLPDDSSIVYEYDNEDLKKISRLDPNAQFKFSHAFLNDHQESFILDLGLLDIQKDDYGRPLSIKSPYRKEEYEFDSDLKQVIVDGEIEHRYEYDLFHRLIKDNEESYEYDERDNLAGHHCDALNRVSLDGYKYDLNGNLIETQTFCFKYDALNRLIEVKGKEATVKYSYDFFNRRMSRNETLFFWDNREEIGSFEDKITDLKILGKGRIVACEIDSVPYAVQCDLKDTPVLYINKETVLKEGPFALQGKRKDPLTGLIYFGARDYDPLLKRFISCDPKGYADGFNLYHYARNNPNRYIDHFGHTSILDKVKEPLSYGWNALKSIYHSLNSFRDWINSFSGLGTAYKYLQESIEVLLGKGFIAFAGGYTQEGQTGIFGNGEINDKVRVTFIHGILNLRADLIDNLRQLSRAHGGINIHYLFRPTQGFAWDILKCISIKFGYVSTEAQELVRIWKSLIEEMGGTNGGGKIIHYAHSLGGTDTFTALSFLSPEEQKMIDVRTLGSATLIPKEGHYSVINYVSVRDGVSYFDPIRYFNAIWHDSNTIFIGTFLGFPFKDHPLSTDSYQEIIRMLGQAFLETYGVL